MYFICCFLHIQYIFNYVKKRRKTVRLRRVIKLREDSNIHFLHIYKLIKI